MKKHTESFRAPMIDDDMISLSDIVSILLNGKKWIIGSVLTCLLGACLYLSVVDPVYRVSTEIKVDPNIKPMIYSMLDIKGVRGTAIGSDIEEIKNTGFIEKIINKNKDKLVFSSESTHEIAKKISVKEKVRGSGVIEISFSSIDPVTSVVFLNIINSSFLGVKKERFFDKLERFEVVIKELKPDIKISEAVFGELKKLVESELVVLKEPIADSRPIKPKAAMIVSLASILGGMFGLILVFISEAMRVGLRTPEEVKIKTGMDVIGVIPDDRVVAVTESDLKANNRLEAVRKLRTNILHKITALNNNQVMLCSPSADTGKEYIITQLAILLAKAGRNTLLVDADIRNGKLFENFNIKDPKGLTDYLISDAGLSVVNVAEKLDIISGTNYQDNPSELLMSEAFNLFLKKASDNYDVVLIDTPPVLEVTDSAIVGSQCDNVLMVIQSESTPLKKIEEVIQHFKLAGVRLSGCIFNMGL